MMDFEEFRTKVKAIDIEYDNKKLLLAKEYADSNNTVKIGDIVKDHIGSVRVEEIKYNLRSIRPDCVYFGQELKKNGEPKKRVSKRMVYQMNMNRELVRKE
jgi:hypothetical protein